MNSLPLSVSIPLIDRDRQRQACVLQGRVSPALRLVLQPVQMDPAGVDVGDGQRLAEVARGVAAVMGHQVDLEEPRLLLVPVGEGADRDLMLEQRAPAWYASAPSTTAAHARGATAGRWWRR